jgi:UDP-N-acetyl-D-mannosaminuronate dehydrogenase
MQDLAKRDGLVSTEQQARKARILVVGVAFKRGQSLLTGSPAVALMQHLIDSWETNVTFADPFVQESDLSWAPRLNEKTEWTKAELQWYDAIVLAVRQPGLDYSLLDSLEGVRIESWN